MGADPRRQTVHHHLKDATHGIAGAEGGVHLRLHLRLDLRVNAAEQNRFARGEAGDLLPGGSPLQLHCPDAGYVTRDADAEFAQQHLGERTAGDTRCGFPGACPLKHIASILKVILEGSREVGVAGPGTGDRLVLAWVAGFDGEQLFPVLPVTVSQCHGDRRTDGVAVAHTGEHMRGVLLDAHATAAAVAPLPAPELMVQELAVKWNSRGQPADEGDERLAVALTGGRKPEHKVPIIPRPERPEARCWCLVEVVDRF